MQFYMCDLVFVKQFDKVCRSRNRNMNQKRSTKAPFASEKKKYETIRNLTPPRISVQIEFAPDCEA